jgi:hypothetical protein
VSRDRFDPHGLIVPLELRWIFRFKYTERRENVCERIFPFDEGGGRHIHFGGIEMLETIIIILLVLWLLGVVSSYTLGGALHMLLVAALVILVIRLATGRRIA